MIKENLLLGHHDSSKGFVQSADYGYLTVSVTFRPVSSVRKSGQLGITITKIHHNILFICFILKLLITVNDIFRIYMYAIF